MKTIFKSFRYGALFLATMFLSLLNSCTKERIDPLNVSSGRIVSRPIVISGPIVDLPSGGNGVAHPQTIKLPEGKIEIRY